MAPPPLSGIGNPYFTVLTGDERKLLAAAAILQDLAHYFEAALFSPTAPLPPEFSAALYNQPEAAAALLGLTRREEKEALIISTGLKLALDRKLADLGLLDRYNQLAARLTDPNSLADLLVLKNELLPAGQPVAPNNKLLLARLVFADVDHYVAATAAASPLVRDNLDKIFELTIKLQAKIAGNKKLKAAYNYIRGLLIKKSENSDLRAALCQVDQSFDFCPRIRTATDYLAASEKKPLAAQIEALISARAELTDPIEQATINLKLGDLFFAQRNYAAAAENYAAACQAHDSVLARSRLGWAQIMLGQYAPASISFQSASDKAGEPQKSAFNRLVVILNKATNLYLDNAAFLRKLENLLTLPPESPANAVANPEYDRAVAVLALTVARGIVGQPLSDVSGKIMLLNSIREEWLAATLTAEQRAVFPDLEFLEVETKKYLDLVSRYNNSPVLREIKEELCNLLIATLKNFFDSCRLTADEKKTLAAYYEQAYFAGKTEPLDPNDPKNDWQKIRAGYTPKWSQPNPADKPYQMLAVAERIEQLNQRIAAKTAAERPAPAAPPPSPAGAPAAASPSPPAEAISRGDSLAARFAEMQRSGSIESWLAFGVEAFKAGGSNYALAETAANEAITRASSEGTFGTSSPNDSLASAYYLLARTLEKRSAATSLTFNVYLPATGAKDTDSALDNALTGFCQSHPDYMYSSTSRILSVNYVMTEADKSALLKIAKTAEQQQAIIGLYKQSQAYRQKGSEAAAVIDRIKDNFNLAEQASPRIKQLRSLMALADRMPGADTDVSTNLSLAVDLFIINDHFGRTLNELALAIIKARLKPLQPNLSFPDLLAAANDCQLALEALANPTAELTRVASVLTEAVNLQIAINTKIENQPEIIAIKQGYLYLVLDLLGKIASSHAGVDFNAGFAHLATYKKQVDQCILIETDSKLPKSQAARNNGLLSNYYLWLEVTPGGKTWEQVKPTLLLALADHIENLRAQQKAAAKVIP